ncbi:hypothetical protein [Arhodomonas sp. SL1]|uniref:hypothetical protein n=1 Tax=Arhodomonas sp. SL1 TaxID=3425691 RepID=UPI003F8825F0
MIERLQFRRERPPHRPGSTGYHEAMGRARQIISDELLGFMVLLVGTVIWGYGDLLLAPLL